MTSPDLSLHDAVIHVTPSYLPVLGGKETYIYEIVSGLKDRRFVVLSSKISGVRLRDEIGSRVGILRVGPRDFYRGPKSLPSPARLRLLVGYTLSLVRLSRQRRVTELLGASMIHSHWSDIGFVEALRGIVPEGTRERIIEMALTVASFQKPTIFTDHSMFLQQVSPSEHRLLAHALQTYEVVVCVEQEGALRAKEMAREVGGSARVEYIPNCVNTDAFSPVDPSGDDRPTICYMGRANKGYDLIFEVIRRLREYRFLLLVAGDQRSLAKWKTVVSDRVHLIVNSPPWDLPDLLAKATVMLNPILIPGISRVTLESLAMGIPVIAATGTSRFPLVSGRTGILVEPTAAAFAKAARELMEDETRRRGYGNEGRRIVVENFSNRIVLPQIASVYANLAS